MFHQLSYTHPRAYRQLLYSGLLLTILGALIHAFQPAVSFFIQAPTVIAAQASVAPTALTTTSVVQTHTSDQSPPGLPASLPSYRLDDTSANPADLARRINSSWFGDQHWPALQQLWVRESG